VEGFDLAGVKRGSTVSQPEKRVFLFVWRVDLKDWGGSNGGQIAVREGAGGAFDAGKCFEKILDDRGDRGIVLSRPDTRAAVGIVGESYSDVSHGFSGGQGFRALVFYG
jgi:hypothetical protein